MIKSLAVFDEEGREHVYLDNRSKSFLPLNVHQFHIIKHHLDFTWSNVKYLVIF